MRGMRPHPLLLFVLLAATGGEASALPRCTPALEGAVACLDGKLCECRHDPGGALSGRPAGVRWNCGALRPACGAVPPPDTGQQQQQPLPIQPTPFPPVWR
jgi:hypothetical protein